MATLTVPSRFNGPPASGNGGYSCGTLAAHLDGPAAVSLRRPVPLGRELDLKADEDGAVRAYAGEELIAEAVPADPLAPWPGPIISLAEARAAAANFAAPPDGVFDHCFVCGQAREDGFDVFTGPVREDDGACRDGLPAPLGHAAAVASPWTPPAWAADADGAVRPEFVWSALDCPAYYALHGTDLRLAFLARQQSEILTAPRAGVTYVAVGVPIERSGRKGLAATAILAADGAVLAHSELLVIVPRDA
jgi:hypothetical protein